MVELICALILVIICLTFIYLSKRHAQMRKSSAAKFARVEVNRPETVNAALGAIREELQAGRNPVINHFMLGEIMRHHLGRHREAEAQYDMAVQLILLDPVAAVREGNIMPEDIIARVNPGLPTNVPAFRGEFLREGTNPFAVRSDPQNVHDSNVVGDVARRYSLLTEEPSFAGLVETIKKSGNTNALQAYRSIVANPAHVYSLDDTDENVMGKVWAHIQTQPNREDLTRAFVEALGDCMQNGSTICVTGRVSNLMDALTSLDPNPQIAKPILTRELLRQGVMDIAATMIRELDGPRKTIYESADEDSEDLNAVKQYLRETLRSKAKSQYDGEKELNSILSEVEAGL